MQQSATPGIQSQPLICDMPSTLARLGSKVDLVREMLDLFREDAPIYQSRLRGALACGDAPGVEHACHSLRGMLCMFGAGAALNVADRLERSAHAGELREAPALELELEHEISRFLDIATAEVARL
jgi:HPt (histidine-containing phosphotransfer) domain-containing protein